MVNIWDDVNDRAKAITLMQCLPELLQKQYQLMCSQSENAQGKGYVALMAKLEGQFRHMTDLAPRAHWEQLELPSKGRITSKIWHDFSVTFKSAQRLVKGATESEAHRLLLSKLPSHFLTKVLRETRNEAQKHKRVLIETIEGVPNDVWCKLIQNVCGVSPLKIVQDGPGRYLVHVSPQDEEEKVLLINGRTLSTKNCSKRVCRASVVHFEMSCEQIFKFVQSELDIKREAEMHLRYRESRVGVNLGIPHASEPKHATQVPHNKKFPPPKASSTQVLKRGFVGSKPEQKCPNRSSWGCNLQSSKGYQWQTWKPQCQWDTWRAKPWSCTQRWWDWGSSSNCMGSPPNVSWNRAPCDC